ncbi:trypsin-like serine protease [Streptomyces sp. NA02950]|uniref:S1 family peptidase n=1 Tax=Streptomyces sp. NA02950 TaxID=2742137 RepID=UPI001590F5A2|nr:trypsin-like serine protease [Streptomyces sp. NA02950]QKV92949.1 trypsin-like serine protease [Streptomyces sp. NA02950]
MNHRNDTNSAQEPGRRRVRRTAAAVATLLATAAATVLPTTGAQAVAGGEKVHSDREAPWMATLAVKGDEPLLQRASCGGALIAPTKVLTAAHCVTVDDLPRSGEYHIGARVLSGDPGRVAGIAGVDVHPRYRLLPSPQDPDNPAASSAAYDIAVVTLDRPVRGVPTLPVARAAPSSGATATLYGHGLTGPSTRGDVLRRGTYRTRPDASCAPATPAPVDGPSVLCGRGAHAVACTGDSGSPLVARRHGRRAVVGVFSFGIETAGKPCGSPGPNFFTDVAAVHAWLTTRAS